MQEKLPRLSTDPQGRIQFWYFLPRIWGDLRDKEIFKTARVSGDIRGVIK
jgi:hypothetical protein